MEDMVWSRSETFFSFFLCEFWVVRQFRLGSEPSHHCLVATIVYFRKLREKK